VCNENVFFVSLLTFYKFTADIIQFTFKAMKNGEIKNFYELKNILNA